MQQCEALGGAIACMHSYTELDAFMYTFNLEDDGDMLVANTLDGNCYKTNNWWENDPSLGGAHLREVDCDDGGKCICQSVEQSCEFGQDWQWGDEISTMEYPATPRMRTPSCNDGYVRTSPHGVEYCVPGKEMAFGECHQYCAEQGTSLPCPKSSAESVFLADLAHFPDYSWIGLYQDKHAATRDGWRDSNWASGCTNSYRNWGYGEPNDWEGHQEECAAVGGIGEWVDIGCGYQGGCICEMTPTTGWSEWDEWDAWEEHHHGVHREDDYDDFIFGFDGIAVGVLLGCLFVGIGVQVALSARPPAVSLGAVGPCSSGVAMALGIVCLFAVTVPAIAWHARNKWTGDRLFSDVLSMLCYLVGGLLAIVMASIDCCGCCGPAVATVNRVRMWLYAVAAYFVLYTAISLSFQACRASCDGSCAVKGVLGVFAAFSSFLTLFFFYLSAASAFAAEQLGAVPAGVSLEPMAPAAIPVAAPVSIPVATASEAGKPSAPAAARGVPTHMHVASNIVTTRNTVF